MYIYAIPVGAATSDSSWPLDSLRHAGRWLLIFQIAHANRNEHFSGWLLLYLVLTVDCYFWWPTRATGPSEVHETNLRFGR